MTLIENFAVVMADRRIKADNLLVNIKANIHELKSHLAKLESCEEDIVYRLYHHSPMKVFWMQQGTIEACDLLKKISPNDNPDDMDDYFMHIMADGTGAKWKKNYDEVEGEMRNVIEAFYHATYFMKMVVKYSEINEAPDRLPSGWACLLELYNIR